MQDNTWVHSTPFAALPPLAVIGGHDCDGAPMYVGRAYHEGDHLPAKVIPSKGAAYVCYGGFEHTKSHYEVLVGHGYAWVPCYNGMVPPNAVRTGSTCGGEPLYVGRGHHGNSLTVGKIHPSQGCLYIPFGGQEIRLNTYEVLVNDKPSWVASTPNYTPPDAVVAGHDTDKATIYVGRAMHEGHSWVQSSAYSSIPQHAVVGGNDADGAMIYVGRALHNGEMLVAKIIPSKEIAFVSRGGAEFPKDHFEVLCGENLEWRHCYDHVIPENAIKCGETSLGQGVYIGRGHYEGSLTVGRISSVHRALFIPFRGVERRLETYEILVELDEAKRPAGWAVSPLPPPPPPIECLNVKSELVEDIKDDIKPPIYVPTLQYAPPPAYSPTASIYSTESCNASAPPPYDASYTKFTPAEQHNKTAYSKFVPADLYNEASSSKFTPAEVYSTPSYTTITPAENYTAPSYPKFGSPQHYNNANMWMAANSTYIPPNAVRAGHDVDMAPVFVCRAFHNGERIPGKAVPSRGCAYVPFGTEEVSKSDFEVLVTSGDNSEYIWVPSSEGNAAAGAVEGGRTAYGEPLYVGRAQYGGSLVPGMIQYSHRCLYIPVCGRKERVSNYEVLVRREEYYRHEAIHMSY